MEGSTLIESNLDHFSTGAWLLHCGYSMALDNLVRLFKTMLYRHLVIKLQVERVLQIDAMESETTQ